MEIKYQHSLEEFLRSPLWDTHTMIFRGVSDAEYELITSLGRVELKDEDARQEYESSVLLEFKRRAYPHLKDFPQNHIDWLALAQHYGLPTRLLDWSTNPLVAMYFATEKYPERDFAVYKRIQSDWWLDYSHLELEGITSVRGVRPPHTNIRFVNQEGVFTVHENPAEPLDDKNVVKYVFPHLIKEEIHWIIKKYGMHPSRIYPGLEGVAKDILQELSGYTRGNRLRQTGSPITWA